MYCAVGTNIGRFAYESEANPLRNTTVRGHPAECVVDFVRKTVMCLANMRIVYKNATVVRRLGH